GIFPTTADFTTDLHSLGQYIQEGHRHLFETVLRVRSDEAKIYIEEEEDNLDNLNYLVGKSLHDINITASEATIQAHVDGGVPHMVIDIPALDAYIFGAIGCFLENTVDM